MNSILRVAGLTALCLLPPAFAAAPDLPMQELAAASGCLTCHNITAPAASDGQQAKPVGPSWSEVAAKYRDQPDAQRLLTETVMHGTNPYESHWKGKVSGLAMPPNAVAISEADATRLVTWILSLDQ